MAIDITIIEIDSKNYYTISSQYLEDIYYVSFMPNSKDLLLCGAVENLELIKDFNTSKKLTKKISTNYYTYKIGFTPNRKKMITIHDKGTITVWDVDSLNIAYADHIRTASRLTSGHSAEVDSYTLPIYIRTI